MFKRLLLTAAAVGMLATSFTASAQTYPVVETVRVRLPNGQYLTLDSGPGSPWWRNERVVTYDRYYYEPEERVYVVYSHDNPPHWPRVREERRIVYVHDHDHDDHHRSHHCPPGQAKKGRC